MAADNVGLCGLWFDGQRYYAKNLAKNHEGGEHPVLDEMKRWLNLYFSGKEPDFTPTLHLVGSAFQIEVWNCLLSIPYGRTVTYGDIAKEIARRHGVSHISAQAVGGAVGRNAISIVVPCHRVVGADGSMTGYAGGIDRKIRLLELEGAIV